MSRRGGNGRAAQEQRPNKGSAKQGQAEDEQKAAERHSERQIDQESKATRLVACGSDHLSVREEGGSETLPYLFRGKPGGRGNR